MNFIKTYRSFSPAATLLNYNSKRFLNIHEYIAMEFLQKNDINVPSFKIAKSPEEIKTCADEIAEASGTRDVVVKAQVLAGGRGKGSWDSGLKGGVKIVYNTDEAVNVGRRMLNHRIFTQQTGEAGQECRTVMVCERKYSRREFYFAIVLDRMSAKPVLMSSNHGGVNIEEVARDTPDAIKKVFVDSETGVSSEQCLEIATSLGFSGPDQIKSAANQIGKLYKFFIKSDCTLLEINPMAEDNAGHVFCMDCKMNFDDNAEFRQREIFSRRDFSQEDERDVKAASLGINYIGLDGSIGCLVNGAGLSMATLDIIKLHGGHPANFLDVGGGASANQVKEALRLITSDSKVQAIFVNIFGGIMRCDVIAHGLVAAFAELNIKIPTVVRLKGTNVDEAKAIIANAEFKIIPIDDLDDAARTVVKLTDMISISREVNIHVNFEFPL